MPEITLYIRDMEAIQRYLRDLSTTSEKSLKGYCLTRKYAQMRFMAAKIHY